MSEHENQRMDETNGGIHDDRESPKSSSEGQLGLELPDSVAFRVSPRTMQMLGRENISSPVTAVVELVKNAYDADATEVRIYLHRASTPNGSITIDDNGEGMAWSDVIDKWLLISTDNKVRAPKTLARERVKVGEKGIGRLAMNRIGNKSTIITNRVDTPALKLDLDWSLYEHDQGQLHEIRHPISYFPVRQGAPSGTTIRLSDLRDLWTADNYQALYDDLALLVPPFSPELTDFLIDFQCDEVPDLNGVVISPMMEKWEFVLDSTLGADGTISHKLRHRSGTEMREVRRWDQAFNDVTENGIASCGPLAFKLFFYLDEVSTLRELEIDRGILRAYLNQYHGIRIYRDRFRVKPYGDPGRDRDWLGLNLRKVQSPAAVGRAGTGYRISGNQVVGAIFVSRDTNPNLKDQTNREGLVENEAYKDMRRFVLHAIQFLERTRSEFERARDTENMPDRKQEVEPTAKLDQTIKSALVGIEKATEGLRGAHERIAAMPLFAGEDANELQASVDLLEHVATQMAEAQSLSAQSQTDRQVLLGLATLGIAMATFGHETMRSTNTLLDSISLLSDTVSNIQDDAMRESARADIAALSRSAAHIQTWGRFALDRVRRDKRRFREVNVNGAIRDVLRTFQGITRGLGITIQFHPAIGQPRMRGFSMDLEAMIVNLVTNALDAMRHKPMDQRIVEVWVNEINEEKTASRFCDSGRGILSEDVPQVFNPLFSTKTDLRGEPTGTGMGLAIVRDVVNGYGGTIAVKGHGELGGAEFLIELPTRRGIGDEQ